MFRRPFFCLLVKRQARLGIRPADLQHPQLPTGLEGTEQGLIGFLGTDFGPIWVSGQFSKQPRPPIMADQSNMFAQWLKALGKDERLGLTDLVHGLDSLSVGWGLPNMKTNKLTHYRTKKPIRQIQLSHPKTRAQRTIARGEQGFARLVAEQRQKRGP